MYVRCGFDDDERRMVAGLVGPLRVGRVAVAGKDKGGKPLSLGLERTCPWLAGWRPWRWGTVVCILDCDELRGSVGCKIVGLSWMVLHYTGDG
jgi:hypothetical protein